MKPGKRTSFQTLCRCLTGALGRPLAPSDLPASPLEWEKVLRLSSDHLVTPQLRWALREQRLFSELPTDVAAFLDAVYALNLERNEECEDQVAQLILVLNSIGVQPVLLKGFAAIVGGLYPTSGERMVVDIDALIPGSRLPEILDVLATVGYRSLESHRELAIPGEWETLSHHYPPIYSPEWPVTVELHVQPVDLPFVSLLSAEQVFASARPVDWRAGACLLPSPTHFISQNIIHSFLVDTQLNLKRVSLRQLFEFALTGRRSGESIDWGAIRTAFDHLGYQSPLRQYLVMINACMNLPFSPEIEADGWDRMRAQPHLLRLDLDSSMLERSINVTRQIKHRLMNVQRKPENLGKLLTKDFYARFFNSL